MDPEWSDWTGDELGDLGTGETADLGADPLPEPPQVPQPPGGEPDWTDRHSGLDWDAEQPEPEFGAGLGGVDAHVDEPLHGPEEHGEAGSWDRPAPGDAGVWTQPPPVPDPLFGTDPDAVDLADAEGWAGYEFPPVLDLADLPEPVDGPPWSDPALLGAEQLPQAVRFGAPEPADLAQYAAMDLSAAGDDPWAALRDAEDPATSALARWWAPPDA